MRKTAVPSPISKKASPVVLINAAGVDPLKTKAISPTNDRNRITSDFIDALLGLTYPKGH
jgi:hypothetical protein